MIHFGYAVGNRKVTVAEILELWQSVDQSITELLSIQIAATFAFLIAMFVVGQRLHRVIFYFAVTVYLLFSAYMWGYLATQMARVSVFLEMLNDAILRDPSLSRLTERAYIQPGEGPILLLVIFALLCLGALVASYFMRKGTAALDS